MRKLLTIAFVVFMNLLVWSYIAKLVFHFTDTWSHFISGISIILLVISFLLSKNSFRLIASLFLITGLAILLPSDIKPMDYWKYFGSTTGILSLICIAPLFSIPITLGAYHRTAQLIFRERISKPLGIHALLYGFTFLLGSLMNVAAIVVSYTTFHRLTIPFPENLSKKIEFTSFSRGHALALVWSPVGATIGSAVSGTHADPIKVIGTGFLFALVMLAIDELLMKRYLAKQNQTYESQTKEHHPIPLRQWVSIIILTFVIILFVAGSLLLNKFLKLNFIDSVILLIVVFSIVWSLLLKKPQKMMQAMKGKLSKGLIGIAPQCLLFVSVGFFSQVLIHTGNHQALSDLMVHIPRVLNWVVIGLVISIAALGSQLGLFPALIVELLANLVPYQSLGLSPELFAIALVVGAAAGVAASPLTVNVNLLAAMTREPPLTIAKSNYPFLLLMIISGILFVTFRSFI